jgi:hypothetical protein
MGFLAGGPVPGSPAFSSYKGTQPDIQAGATQVPITVQGIPTPGEPITLTVGTDTTSVQPATLTYTVLASDSVNSIATALAALIEAAIGAATVPWSTDFASSAATGNVARSVVANGVNLATLSIAVGVQPGSMLSILPVHYPEAVAASSTEVTGLKTFAYCGESGTFNVYKGQRILVSNDVAQDMITQGLAE